MASTGVTELEMGDAEVFTTQAAEAANEALKMVVRLTGIPPSNIRSFTFAVGELVVEELARTPEGLCILREDKQDMVIHERRFHMPGFSGV